MPWLVLIIITSSSGTCAGLRRLLRRKIIALITQIMPRRKQNRRKPRRRLKIRGAGRRRRKLPSNVGSLPAGYQRQMKARMSISRTKNGIRISGMDLVSTLPDVVQTEAGHEIFQALPCNPCYWMGTRIAAMAAAYQNFRPIRMVFHYVPQVAVTTPGTVIVGTLWNTPGTSVSFEQVLVTSNGGNMCQCYVPFSTSVTLGSNLPQNLFTCAGNFDTDHNPFIFCAMMKGTPGLVPGYFFVEYVFDLKNPLGYSVRYELSRSVTPFYGRVTPNRMIVTLAALPSFAGPGTVYDVEADGLVYYEGTSVFIPDGIPILVLNNSPPIPPTEVQGPVKSVIFTLRQYPEGTKVSSLSNFTEYDWDRDVATGHGECSDTGNYTVFANSITDNLRVWTESGAKDFNVYVNKLDTASRTIGPLIQMARLATNGSPSFPNLLFPILNRHVVQGPVKDLRPPPPSIEPEEDSEEEDPLPPAKPDAKPPLLAKSRRS